MLNLMAAGKLHALQATAYTNVQVWLESQQLSSFENIT